MKRISTETISQLAYFKRHTSGSTPFCMCISSPNPGAHVVIVGGTHGNEPGGVKAIVQLHRAFRNREIALNRGKISFLLGNPKAYEKDLRYIDSDLNRMFVKQDPSKDIKTGTKLSKGRKYARDVHGYHVAPQDCHVVVPSLVVKPTDDDAGFLGRRTVLKDSEFKRL